MNRDNRPPDAVTDSEIASFVYCGEQWRLERGLKLPLANQAVMADGRGFHAELATKGEIERGATSLLAWLPLDSC
jgi:hypothetical protein